LYTFRPPHSDNEFFNFSGLFFGLSEKTLLLQSHLKNQKLTDHEKDISAFTQEEKQQARIPEQDVYCQWKKGSCLTPGKRQEKTLRQRRTQAQSLKYHNPFSKVESKGLPLLFFCPFPSHYPHASPLRLWPDNFIFVPALIHNNPK